MINVLYSLGESQHDGLWQCSSKLYTKQLNNFTFWLVVTALGGQQEYGVWKEVIAVTIEMGVSVGGFGEGETRWKLGNSSALVAQSTLMINNFFCKIGICLIMLSSNSSYSPQFSPIYNGKNTKLELFGVTISLLNMLKNSHRISHCMFHS